MCIIYFILLLLIDLVSRVGQFSMIQAETPLTSCNFGVKLLQAFGKFFAIFFLPKYFGLSLISDRWIRVGEVGGGKESGGRGNQNSKRDTRNK